MAARKTTKKTTEAPAEETTEATPEEATDTITAKQLATELGTDPKSLRRWLRSITTNRAGKGGRWVFDPDTVTELKAKYAERSSKGTKPELEEVAAEA